MSTSGDWTNMRSRKTDILLALLALGLLLGIQAAATYYMLFSTLMPYDDEGSLMTVMDQVCRGKALGDEVYCYYGPAYPLTYKLFFRLTGLGVSHDVNRFIALALWFLVVVVCWFTCYSITRRAAVSLIVCYAASYCAGFPSWCEPGHPQGIIMLALALVPALAAALLPRRTRCFALLSGAIIGYVLMCKVNVGLFGLGALSLTLVAATDGNIARGLKWAMLLAALAAPTLLIWRHLDTEAGGRLALVATLAFAAALAQVVWVARPERAWPPQQSTPFAGAQGRATLAHGFALRDWWWAAAGCLGVVIAACGATLLSGASLQALMGMTVLTAMRHIDIYDPTFPLSALAVVLSLASAAASLTTAILTYRQKWRRLCLAVEWTTRLLFVGVTMPYFISFWWVKFEPLYQFAFPLLWIGLAPVRSPIGVKERLVRNASVLLAVFHGLVIYPVSGSQLAVACLFFMPVLGFVLHDMLAGLAAILPAPARAPIVQRIAAVLVALLLLASGWPFLCHERNSYRNLTPLGLPGSRHLHLSGPDVLTLRFLAANLKQPQREFITIPGLNSLYFWTQKQPPAGLETSDWMFMLSDQQQTRIAAALENERDLWSVLWLRQAGRRMAPERFADKPLVRFALSRSPRINAVGGFQLGKRNAMGPVELVHCVHWGAVEEPQPQQSWLLVCRIPLDCRYEAPLGAIAIGDMQTGRILASSCPIPNCQGEVAITGVADPSNAARRFDPALGIDSGQEIRLTVRLPRAVKGDAPDAIQPGPHGYSTNKVVFLVAHLLGPHGEHLDSIPFLEAADMGQPL